MPLPVLGGGDFGSMSAMTQETRLEVARGLCVLGQGVGNDMDITAVFNGCWLHGYSQTTTTRSLRGWRKSLGWCHT
jgi:hypothetical protein